MGQSKTVIVVGAGIVGVSTALALQSRGYQVTVIDRTGVAAQASQGNAGAFAFAEVQPLASPGIMLKAPKWIMDPLGPLSIPPRYLAQIMPWMLRFWRASCAMSIR
jgi:D-amino-acid dehydrogenase